MSDGEQSHCPELLPPFLVFLIPVPISGLLQADAKASAESWGFQTPVTLKGGCSFDTFLGCEHGVMSAQGIDPGQGNPHGWRREPMGMTQELARAAAGGTHGISKILENLPERIPQHRPGETELSRQERLRGLSRSLPQVCSCSPAPAAREAQPVLGALLAPRGEQRCHRREGRGPARGSGS